LLPVEKESDLLARCLHGELPLLRVKLELEFVVHRCKHVLLMDISLLLADMWIGKFGDRDMASLSACRPALAWRDTTGAITGGDWPCVTR